MIKDYIIEKKLGVGTYGVVYMVSKKQETNFKSNNKKGKNLYVIKQIPLFGLTPSEIKEVKSEANILSQIKSTYVVKYFDSFEDKNNLNIVMEYCDGGDLEQFLDDKKKYPLDEELIWRLFIQILIGLTAIHNLKILHRDLKTSNIFLTKDLNIKIGDLGVAKKLSRGKFAKTIIGTPYYLSPEICEEKPYNEKSDIWALGCILYELCTFHHPFEAKSQGALVLKILNGNPTPIKKSYSEDLQKVITLILDKNIYKRPSCKTILKLPYIIEKVKKFNMIQQYQNIGLKIPNKSNPFRKIIIKRAKIDLSEDSHIKKSNNIKTNKIKLDISNTSNDNSNINNINVKQNKNKSHFMKKDNPWSTEYNSFRKDIKNSQNNKFLKKPINVIKILNDDILKNKNSSKKKPKKISPSKRSPIKSPNKNINKDKKIISNKNNFQKKENKKIIDNNKKEEKNLSVQMNLDNTLELNKIINNYLSKGDNMRESKNLENILEFANNLNNYFSNSNNSNKNNNNVNINIGNNNSPFILSNKDNNIEQDEINDNKSNEKNISNKKEHENILNFDLDRLTTKKLGINSFEELLNDFSASRGTTMVNKLNNNQTNGNKINIPPIEIEKQNLNNNNEDNNNNNSNKVIINNRETIFKIIDNKNNINNNKIQNKDNNLCESDDEKNNNINKEYLEEEDNSDIDDSGEEKVTIIMHNEDINNLNKKNDEKERILEDKLLLTERLESIKEDMLNLIGEKDYKYIMELYAIIDKTKIDEIYVKIEEYAQKYDEDKKDKFDILYFKLISTDYQVQQKNDELEKLYFNDF